MVILKPLRGVLREVERVNQACCMHWTQETLKEDPYLSRPLREDIPADSGCRRLPLGIFRRRGCLLRFATTM